MKAPQKLDLNQTKYGHVPRNECKYGVIKAYWEIFHKPIYIVSKLPNTLPMYNKKPLLFSFL